MTAIITVTDDEIIIAPLADDEDLPEDEAATGRLFRQLAAGANERRATRHRRAAAQAASLMRAAAEEDAETVADCLDRLGLPLDATSI